MPHTITRHELIRTILVAAVIAVGAFAAGTFAGTYTRSAQWTEPPTAEVDPAYVEEVERLFVEVKSDIATTRGLEPPADASVKIIPLQWYRAQWGERLAKSNIEELRIQQDIYRALLMMPPTGELKDVKIEWATSVAAATVGSNVWVIRENFDPTSRVTGRATLAHELVHILQDVHLKRPSPSTFDGELAARALIEGDADFATQLYLAGRGEGPTGDREAQQDPTRTLDNPVLALDFFPYRYGAGFVEMLWERGEWSLVDAAYDDPPATSEQVMHPLKYLLREEALAVATPQPRDEGWVLIKTDTMGEYFIQAMLNAHIAASQALPAAEGWGGDRLVYYVKSETYQVAWTIAWDTADDAVEFYTALEAALEVAGAERQTSNSWETPEGVLHVELQNQTVLLRAYGTRG